MSHRVHTVLGLDVSSKSTGYAAVKRGRWLHSAGKFGVITPIKGMSLAEKLVFFRDELEKVIEVLTPDLIVIEDVFAGPNIAVTKLLARFSGVAVEISKRKIGAEPVLITPASVRSFLGVKGKEAAFTYICNRYNLDWKFKKYNDITDAISMALYGYQELRHQ